MADRAGFGDDDWCMAKIYHPEQRFMPDFGFYCHRPPGHWDAHNCVAGLLFIAGHEGRDHAANECGQW